MGALDPDSDSGDAGQRSPRADESSSARLRFGILCVLGYVILSWAVRRDLPLGQQLASLVYPLDTFSMYAGLPAEDRSILLVRDHDGRTHRVTSFHAFDCDDPVTGDGARCSDRRGIPYHFDDLARHVQAHPGNGDLEVELITRTWRIESDAAAVQTTDCVITRCRVSR